jgi:hypothetical protein
MMRMDGFNVPLGARFSSSQLRRGKVQGGNSKLDSIRRSNQVIVGAQETEKRTAQEKLPNLTRR